MRWDEPAPNEREAEERAWEIFHAAWSTRSRAARRPAVRSWPVAAFAAALVVVAAALSPPGMAVFGSIRNAVRHNTDHLTSLPTSGELLLNTPAGAWVVRDDGSKRLLRGYADAAWSPHGLYVAAARGNELVAMEPNGRVHWKLARDAPIASPTWSFEGYRIAYLAGHALRIVNGDGTGDRLLSPNAVGSGLPAFAWRPGTHELAYKNARNDVLLVDVDRSRILWRYPATGVSRLLWSDDGRRLFVNGGPRPTVLDASGRRVRRLAFAGSVAAAAFVPRTESLTLALDVHGRSRVDVFQGSRYETRKLLFSGAGAFGGLAWSPDARWLLVDWSSADQWVFVRVSPSPRVRTISNVNATFGTGPEHFGSIAGWCCG
jgi:hypothetical protein